MPRVRNLRKCEFMTEDLQHQWEFGNLFDTQPSRKVWSVVEVSASIKRYMEERYMDVWIQGEITNLRRQGSGHIYFSLKDAGAQLNCVLFRGISGVDREHLKDGLEVLIRGGITVYEPRGQYQLRVEEVELKGEGKLQIEFQHLKDKLQREGLFDQERKKPLPRYPQTIGMVTSPTGAAIRDIVHVIGRRHPALEIVLCPARVQGKGSAREIARSIQLLNEWSQESSQEGGSSLDLILVTRGGGSLEDLWAFNEEQTARAIDQSRLPVISAVGHEIDFTISDFVADFRAATPSAAAEIITEGHYAARTRLTDIRSRLVQLGLRNTRLFSERLKSTVHRLQRSHPRRRLDEKSQRLDDLEDSLRKNLSHRLQVIQSHWENLRLRFDRLTVSQRIQREGEKRENLTYRMIEALNRSMELRKNRMDRVAERLRLLSPEHVLLRGYSITSDVVTGDILRSEQDIRTGQILETRLSDGKIRSKVLGD